MVFPIFFRNPRSLFNSTLNSLWYSIQLDLLHPYSVPYSLSLKKKTLRLSTNVRPILFWHLDQESIQMTIPPLIIISIAYIHCMHVINSTEEKMHIC
uniref:Uncharacterized protein n=1 Tax=Arundo donax TaxID=35708 RepID=A0A0A9GIP8_ARUDO